MLLFDKYLNMVFQQNVFHIFFLIMQGLLGNSKHLNMDNAKTPVGKFPVSSENPSCLHVPEVPIGILGQFLFIENKYTSCLKRLW